MCNIFHNNIIILLCLCITIDTTLTDNTYFIDRTHYYNTIPKMLGAYILGIAFITITYSYHVYQLLEYYDL